MSKLLGNRRRTYILGVIFNRFYFGEVQEEVLGQWSGEGILAPRREGLSVYQWSVPDINKQSGWGNAFVNTPLKFLSLSWKFWKNRKSDCFKFLENLKAKINWIPKLCCSFLIHFRKFYMLWLSCAVNSMSSNLWIYGLSYCS